MKSINPIVTQQVLHDLNLEIHEGDFTCIAGPSGSGKSTLLNLLGFIETIQKGKIIFRDNDVKSLSPKMLDHIRMFEIGFVFQDFQLFDVLDVYENVEYFVARQGFSGLNRKKKIIEALEIVGLVDFQKKFPRELSGGQKQRVAIARALAKNPKVIIADEPTANLDSKNAQNILNLLGDLSKKYHQTTIMASHDPLAMSSATRLLELRDGIIHRDQYLRSSVHAS